MSEPLTRVDSGIEGLSTSPTTKSHPDPSIPDPVDRVDSGIADLSLQNKKTAQPEPQPKAPESLDRVDSGIAGLSSSPPKDKAAHRRASSSATAFPSAKDMWESKTKLHVSPETQKTGWKINMSALTVDDRDVLKKPLVTPMVRAIDLVTDLGSVIIARNRHGVTIKDAMDAIHKVNKKRADDELEKPYLEGFEWAPEHSTYEDTAEENQRKATDWQRLYIHLTSTPTVSHAGGKKKKNKSAE